MNIIPYHDYLYVNVYGLHSKSICASLYTVDFFNNTTDVHNIQHLAIFFYLLNFDLWPRGLKCIVLVINQVLGEYSNHMMFIIGLIVM